MPDLEGGEAIAGMNARLAALDFITACLGVRQDREHNDALSAIIESGRCSWEAVIVFSRPPGITKPDAVEGMDPTRETTAKENTMTRGSWERVSFLAVT